MSWPSRLATRIGHGPGCKRPVPSSPSGLIPERNSYQLLGLERSFWNSWGPRQLWYYARAVLRGQELSEYRGDTLQMGGNLIVDRTGRIRYLYRSRASTDRPAVTDLLDILHQLS